MGEKVEYSEFLASKRISADPVGIEPSEITDRLFPFQQDIVRWALRRGRAAIFENCGLGKTIQQGEWARQISINQGMPVLIVAPLAVSHQTLRELAKFGIAAHIAIDDAAVKTGINITNYEKLHHFDPAKFCGLVLDESSILKGFDGKLRRYITGFARRIPYRLSASATPAPNDYMELGTQAEFLDIMSYHEMLATFFTHDGSDTSKWRLKGHAERDFWKWLASWSVCIQNPADIGYEDDGFTLPAIHFHQHTVISEAMGGYLFPMEAQSLLERGQARKDSIGERVSKCAELVNGSDAKWIVWCNLNAEGEALQKAIPGAIQVQGSDSPEYKEKHLLDFCEGRSRVVISKPKIAGFGLNMQVCHNIAFVGLSDSYEQVYQAIRRCWRFGQTEEVHCHIIAADTEGAVVRNIQRKEAQSERMAASMVEHMRDICRANIRGQVRERTEYTNEKLMTLPTWIKGING